MKRVALTLAALVVLGVAANQALAQGRGAKSYPAAAHVAAKNAIQHGGSSQAVQQVRYRPAHRKPPKHYRQNRGRARVIIQPPVWGYPAVIGPRWGHPPVVRPPIYRYPRYYGPRRGITYYGSGFSIGIGF